MSHTDLYGKATGTTWSRPVMVREANGVFARSDLRTVCDAAHLIGAIVVCLKDDLVGDYIVLRWP